MESWLYELDRARDEGRTEGFKNGVTVGYKHGWDDALNDEDRFQICAGIGYNTHNLDMLEVFEELLKYRPDFKPAIDAILEALKPIENVREQANKYAKQCPK